jgi:hypothetical protein
MPSVIDLLVFSGLSLFAILPYALSYLRRPVRIVAQVPLDDSNHAAWQTKWTNTLIQLLNELEENDDAEAVSLTRDLMWQILGGTDEKPAPGGKK